MRATILTPYYLLVTLLNGQERKEVAFATALLSLILVQGMRRDKLIPVASRCQKVFLEYEDGANW